MEWAQYVDEREMSCSSVTSEMLGGDRTPASYMRIRMFGAFEIEVNGSPLPKTRSRTEMWLLAYLILRAGREAPRSTLAGSFWPDTYEDQALNNLRRSLSNLRQALGPAAARLLTPTRYAVAFDLTGVQLDVSEFEAAAARADRLSLEAAIEMYRGPLLEAYDADWANTHRRALEQSYLRALDNLATILANSDSPARAIDCLQRIVDIEPTREPVHRRLFEVLWRSGDVGAMIQAYRKFRLYLHNELQSDPEPETTALFQRLKTTPPPVSMETVACAVDRGYLPTILTKFFGREQELDRLTRLFKEDKSRLITLSGMGGAGKTRLAIEWGARIRTDMHSVVWFVSLADVHRADLFYSAICDVVSPGQKHGIDPLEHLVSEIGDTKTLLIIDNFEQLTDCAAPMLLPLLERLPSLSLLVTSRQQLGISGEASCELASLPTPNRTGPPDRLLEFPSIQLFVDRVRLKRTDFGLTRANVAPVAALLKKLDGIPLAIELAAGWSTILTPQQMLAQMQNRFDFLVTVESSDLPARHRSMRAVLEASFDLLAPEQQDLLCALTVFRGGWTLDAAVAISNHPNALKLLARLRERSMVETMETSDSEAPLRFQMLESLREFAGERLNNEDRLDLNRRHAEYFGEMVQNSRDKWRGNEQASCLRLIDAECDNMRAMLSWRYEHCVETTLELTTILAVFWRIRGYVMEGSRWLMMAIEHCQGAETRPRASAYVLAGSLAIQLGDIDESRKLYEEGLALYRSIDDKHGISAALNNLGIVARNVNDFERARAYYEESLEIDEELNDRWGVAASLNNLGNMAASSGDFETARTRHEQALRIRRDLGEQQGVAWSLYNLGNVYRHMHTDNVAASLFQESLQLSRELGDRLGSLLGLMGLTELALRRNDYYVARDLISESLGLLAELGNRGAGCAVLLNCALLAEISSRPQSAAKILGCAEALRASINLPIDPQDQADYDALVSRLKGAVGLSEYDALFALGQNMNWQETLDFAAEDARYVPEFNSVRAT